MTLAKFSSAQGAAETCVPTFQHVGDCISHTQGTVNMGEPRLSACGVGGRARGGQGDLAWLFPRRAAQGASLELRDIPVHGSYVLQPSTAGREQQCLVQHQPLALGALPASL